VQIRRRDTFFAGRDVGGRCAPAPRIFPAPPGCATLEVFPAYLRWTQGGTAITVASPSNVETSRPRPSSWWFGLLLTGTFVLAVVVRLTGTLRAAGLYGLGNYDDGVHFAAGLGLVNGLLPYRDFLLLHPPGVVLVMAPFAAASWVIGEPDAMAVARVTWILLGGVNAILCGLVLRPLSRVAGLVAALFYALSIGAVYVEHTALLEAPATTALLLGLLITRLPGSGDGIHTRHYVLAGLVLGLSPVLKIWGVVAVLVVVVAIWAQRGRRPAVVTLAASVVSCAAACLPFFLAAPREMWRMVVVAQVGRRRANERVSDRLSDVLGVREWGYGSGLWSVWLVIMVVAVLGATVICLIVADLRVVAALMITHGLLVMTTPMWFLHYAGLTAAPLALTVGGALAAVLGWSRSVRWLAPTLVGLAVVGVIALAYPMRDVQLGKRDFPAAHFAAASAAWDGCTTTDWPMTLIQMDLLQSDIDRGCRFVVDLGGYSYYHVDSPYHQDARRQNEDWQALALDYYRSGDAVIAVRFDTATGFSRATARTIRSWPVIVEEDGFEIRRPQPEGG
jgi:alpha-1,2-mannosyltransferase